MARTQTERAEAFRALHEGDTFIIPNPWDAGSAKVMEALGFEALATTSGGFAFTLGRLDGAATLDDVIEHTRALAEASDLPVSVDLENGYGREPADAARAIESVAAVGAVGGSIEDYDPDEGLYEIGFAAERVAAAAEAAASAGFPFTLTGRAENHIRKNPDLDDTIARLRAYDAAGADVLYAPGIVGDDIATVCAEFEKPVNVLAFPGMRMSELRAAGATRISVGSQFAWVAVAAMAEAAEEIRDGDSFDPLTANVRVKEWLG